MTHTVSFYMLKFSRSWIFWQESFHVVDYLPLKIELTIYVANWPMNVQREMTYVPYNGIPVLILNFYLSDELILGFRTLKWIFYLTSFFTLQHSILSTVRSGISLYSKKFAFFCLHLLGEISCYVYWQHHVGLCHFLFLPVLSYQF